MNHKSSIPLVDAAEFFLDLKKAASAPVADPDMTGQLEGRFTAPVEEVLKHFRFCARSKLRLSVAYRVYSEELRSVGNTFLGEHFKQHGYKCLENVDFFIRRSTVLGGPVELGEIDTPPPQTEIDGIIKTLIRLEQENIALLRTTLPMMGDNPSKYELEHMLSDDQHHLDDMWQHLPQESRHAILDENEKRAGRALRAAGQKLKENLTGKKIRDGVRDLRAAKDSKGQKTVGALLSALNLEGSGTNLKSEAKKKITQGVKSTATTYGGLAAAGGTLAALSSAEDKNRQKAMHKKASSDLEQATGSRWAPYALQVSAPVVGLALGHALGGRSSSANGRLLGSALGLAAGAGLATYGGYEHNKELDRATERALNGGKVEGSALGGALVGGMINAPAAFISPNLAAGLIGAGALGGAGVGHRLSAMQRLSEQARADKKRHNPMRNIREKLLAAHEGRSLEKDSGFDMGGAATGQHTPVTPPVPMMGAAAGKLPAPKMASPISLSKAKGLKRVTQLLTGSRAKKLEESLKHTAARAIAGAKSLPHGKNLDEKTTNAARVYKALGRVQDVAKKTEKERSAVGTARGAATLAGGVGIGGGAITVRSHTRKKKEKTAAPIDLKKAKGLKRVGQLLTGSRAENLVDSAKKRIPAAVRRQNHRGSLAIQDDVMNLSRTGSAGIDRAMNARRATNSVRRLADSAKKETESVAQARRQAKRVGAATAATGVVGAAALHASKKEKTAAEKSDADQAETGRQRAIANLASGFTSDKASRGERYGDLVGRAAGAAGGLAAGLRASKGGSPAVRAAAGLGSAALGSSLAGRVGKAIGSERDNAKFWKEHGEKKANAGVAVAAILAGYSPGRRIAGDTAAGLAPHGRIGRSEDVARTLGTLSVPAGALTAMALAHRYDAAGRMSQLARSVSPRGVLGSPETDAAFIRMATPAASALLGGLVGGAVTGLGVGGVQALRGTPKRSKEASDMLNGTAGNKSKEPSMKQQGRTTLHGDRTLTLEQGKEMDITSNWRKQKMTDCFRKAAAEVGVEAPEPAAELEAMQAPSPKGPPSPKKAPKGAIIDPQAAEAEELLAAEQDAAQQQEQGEADYFRQQYQQAAQELEALQAQSQQQGQELEQAQMELQQTHEQNGAALQQADMAIEQARQTAEQAMSSSLQRSQQLMTQIGLAANSRNEQQAMKEQLVNMSAQPAPPATINEATAQGQADPSLATGAPQDPNAQAGADPNAAPPGADPNGGAPPPAAPPEAAVPSGGGAPAPASKAKTAAVPGLTGGLIGAALGGAGSWAETQTNSSPMFQKAVDKLKSRESSSGGGGFANSMAMARAKFELDKSQVAKAHPGKAALLGAGIGAGAGASAEMAIRGLLSLRGQ